MTILNFGGKKPRIDRNVFVAEGAMIIGDVRIARDSSIWFNAVIRGDQGGIEIGRNVSIQDCCVLHSSSKYSLKVGNNVVIGHGAVIHGCNIRSNCLIGLKSVILNDAEIGEWSIVGASSLIAQGTVVPSRSVVMGVPGRIVRKATEEDVKQIGDNARSYLELKNRYLQKGKNEYLKKRAYTKDASSTIKKET